MNIKRANHMLDLVYKTASEETKIQLLAAWYLSCYEFNKVFEVPALNRGQGYHLVLT